MKRKLPGILAATFYILWPSFLWAGTTIDATNRYAYAGNLGWVDGVADTNSGAVIGEYVCSGNVYSANAGWINLGSGSPADQIQYQNNSATDFGVNLDGYGNLTGYAWGASVGWIAFEQTFGQPKINLYNGQFSGSVWSANCGWISLSNATAYVQTDSIRQGALAADGLPIAWLLQNFGTTNINANSDPTGKGMTIGQDYLAGTDPNSAASVFKVISISRTTPNRTTLDWNSVATRYYAIQTNSSLSRSAWNDLVGLDIPGWNNGTFTDTTSTNRFYRIRAFRPLMPY